MFVAFPRTENEIMTIRRQFLATFFFSSGLSTQTASFPIPSLTISVTRRSIYIVNTGHSFHPYGSVFNSEATIENEMARVSSSSPVMNQPSHVNPFTQFNEEWRVGLFDCTSDMSQCEIDGWPTNFFSTHHFFHLGFTAYVCWWCFMTKFSKRIGESTPCFVPSALAVYRMKIRSVLKIKVSSTTHPYRRSDMCPSLLF